MKKWIASFVSLLLVIFTLSPLSALAGEKGKYAGKTAEIGQDSKSFKLITTDKTWLTKWTEKTDFIFEGKKTTPDQLKNDTQVLVIAIEQEDGATLEAIIVAWGEAPGKDPKEPPKDPGKDPGSGRQMPMVFGKMSEFKTTDKTFTLSGKDPKGNDFVFKVTYREETKFVRDKKLAKPEDFKDGEEVTVAGKIDLDAKTISALMVVLGKVEIPKDPKDPGKDPGGGKEPPTIYGTITRLNLERKVFQLTVKDKDGKEVGFEVKYSQETKFFIEKKPVQASDFKVGDLVTVAGRIDQDKKIIEAVLVVKGKIEQPGNPDKPGIIWEKDSIIREKYSIFNDESIDINFKSTINQDSLLKITVSEPWLELKTDQVKISDQKLTVKIIGQKLVAWKTNTAVINITLADNPGLNKRIFVSIDAIGNIVIVKIGSNKATVNMKEVTLDEGSRPLIQKGRTYVSIKFMSEIVFNNKAQTSFEPKTQTVYFSMGSKKIELYIGKPYALVNGVKVALDAPPFIKSGRTFVPLRFISENLDATVAYDANSQTITIVYPGKTN